MSNLSCAEAKQHVYGYLDNELDQQTRQMVDGHLAECSTCTAEYDLERTIANLVISSSSSLDLDSDFHKKISTSLRAELE